MIQAQAAGSFRNLEEEITGLRNEGWTAEVNHQEVDNTQCLLAFPRYGVFTPKVLLPLPHR